VGGKFLFGLGKGFFGADTTSGKGEQNGQQNGFLHDVSNMPKP